MLFAPRATVVSMAMMSGPFYMSALRGSPQSWSRIIGNGKSSEKQGRESASQHTEPPQLAPYTGVKRLQSCAFFKFEQHNHELDRDRDLYRCFRRVFYETAPRQMRKMMQPRFCQRLRPVTVMVTVTVGSAMPRYARP
jgi:hypothetical protein